MRITGTEPLPAAREAVWAELIRPEVLCACIPGCEGMSGTPEGGFDTVVRLKIGPLRPRFSGVMAMRDAVFPERYRIVGAGRGGRAGFAGGETLVELEPAGPGQTLLRYTVTVGPSGRLAKLGEPVIEALARAITAGFFKRLREHLE